MNVYDFDDTIYDGDSSLDFLLFEGRRRLMAFIKACVKSVFPTMRYLCKLGTKENMKEHFFSVVRDVQDMDLEIKAFWDAVGTKFGSRISKTDLAPYDWILTQINWDKDVQEFVRRHGYDENTLPSDGLI